MVFSDKTYETLKWLCLIGLPAFATFIGAILPVIGVGSDVVAVVVTIISAVITFIGTLIGISNVGYKNDIKVGGTDV